MTYVVKGAIPDFIVRVAIRVLLRKRLREIGDGGGSWLDIMLGGKRYVHFPNDVSPYCPRLQYFRREACR